jgi:hypothetical protein
MSTENTTYAFQVAATNGVGLTQFFSEQRFTTFRITGNGSVSAGAVTIECCPGNAPMTATPIKTNLKQSEEFEDNPDNDNYSYYVGDVSGHAGD